MVLTYLSKPFLDQRRVSLFFQSIFLDVLLSAINEVCSNHVARGLEAS